MADPLSLLGTAVVTDYSRLPRSLETMLRGNPCALVGPPALAAAAPSGTFLDIAHFDKGECLPEAREILRQACAARDKSGRLLLEGYRWLGMNLWAFHYFDAFSRFCLPLSRYGTLIEHCNRNFAVVRLRASPELMRAFQAGYRGELILAHTWRDRAMAAAREFHFLVNNAAQLMLSLLCLPWLCLRRNRMGLFSLDFASAGGPWDFRFQGVHAELRRRRDAFTEYVWTFQRLHVMLANFVRRRKPVIYTGAVVNLCRWLWEAPSARKAQEAARRSPDLGGRIIALACPRGMGHLKVSIRILAWVFRWTGLRAFFAYSLIDRTFAELAACRLTGIKVVGIVHGMPMPEYTLWEFYEDMPEAAELRFFDAYGAWSEGMRENLLRRSKLFREDNLEVSGYLRRGQLHARPLPAGRRTGDPVRVLWISEPLLDPTEAWPYLEKLLAEPGMRVTLKVRPMYTDAFQAALSAKYPDAATRLAVETGDIFEALARHDIAVGSHSTGALDAVPAGRPFVLFRTRKWGDCFNLKGEGLPDLFAESPEEFPVKIRRALDLSPEALERLKSRYFGEDDKDGGRWVVEKLHALVEATGS